MVQLTDIRLCQNFDDQTTHPTTVCLTPTERAFIDRLEAEPMSDEQLRAYTAEFDRVRLTDIAVPMSQIKSAYQALPATYVSALRQAYEQIADFHQKQRPTDWMDSPRSGVQLGMQYRPLERVGLYVPGGQALYPSSVLMNAIPAEIAGVDGRVIVTPPQPDGSVHPAVLVAADLCGVEAVYRVGGAQAVFALAKGTETIPAVDKIVGPGNRFVAEAKQRVSRWVDIDKPAGPSEVLVYVDDSAYVDYAAAECLAQCEHDADASAAVISTDLDLLQALDGALVTQAKRCQRQDILAKTTVSRWHATSLDEAIQTINLIASEHVVLLSDDHAQIRPQIQHAGAIFSGPYTPVALGDYLAGPNHVLPTARAARFSSPLGVMDFMKASSLCEYSKKALITESDCLSTLAMMEGLDAHAQSVTIRITDVDL